MGKLQNPIFGDMLRTYRHSAGLTHEELATRSHLSVRGISDLERGLIHCPRRETVRLLAMALQLAPVDRERLEAATHPSDGLPTDSKTVRPSSSSGDAAHPPSAGVPTNLPAQLSSFVGRDREVRELSARLRTLGEPRLLTLIGVGGCGKTRLALRVAAEVGQVYPDGVWFVDLAPLVDPALVVSAVATTLGIAEPPDGWASATLVTALRSRHSLLVLDNCEHLVDTIARLAEDLLRGCRQLRILATSRESLRLPSEVTWSVLPLTIPLAQAAPTVESLLASESGQLMVGRAVAIAPSFSPTPENAGAIAQICRQLDGLPLAIELAAAQLRLLDVDQITTRLNSRFQFLTRGTRTAPRRHQTLRALMDWSYELLSPGERAVLRRLAVFAGTWTLEAAEAVCSAGECEIGGGERLGLPPISRENVVGLLTRLADKSLIVVDRTGGERRYRLLETIRQYGEEKLRETGEAAQVRSRQRDYYVALSEAAFPELNGPRHGAWMARLLAEHDNLRAALAWCRRHRRSATKGLRLLANLGWYFVSSHRFGEGCQWLDEFLALSPARNAVRARALLANARLRLFRGDVAEARRNCAEGLAVTREIGDELATLQLNAKLAQVEASEGNYGNAQTRLEACLAGARAQGDVEQIRDWTRDLGTVAIVAGDDERARALLEESLVLARQTGNAGHVAMALLRLSDLDRWAGDLATAQARAEACRPVFRQARVAEDPVLTCLGNLARARGDFGEARLLLTDVLRRADQRGDRNLVAEKLCWLGVLAVAEGDYVRGARQVAAALAENPYFATIHMPDVRREVEASLEHARAVMGQVAFAAAWAEGQARTTEQEVALTLNQGEGRVVG
jgi:non-specific serine/threonine protein kinase